MAKTEIRAFPFVSVNEIAFGTPREEVWQILGKPEDSFHKARRIRRGQEQVVFKRAGGICDIKKDIKNGAV